MARRYAKQTTRRPRQTWTDKLIRCETWQQVMALPDPAELDYLRGVVHLEKIHLENLPVPIPGPTWDAESHDKVEGWVAQLPLQEREAFVLIHLEGLSLRAAAPLLECSHETARVRFDRARKRMSKIILRDISPDDDGGIGDPGD